MKEQYIPRPEKLSGIRLPDELEPLVELMAKNVHEVWAAGRMAEGWTWGPERDAEGWTWGPERDDGLKRHPCLVPYEELPESERDYDRNTALNTLKLILSLGFKIQR